MGGEQFRDADVSRVAIIPTGGNDFQFSGGRHDLIEAATVVVLKEPNCSLTSCCAFPPLLAHPARRNRLAFSAWRRRTDRVWRHGDPPASCSPARCLYRKDPRSSAL